MGFTRIETLSLTDLFVQQIENMILSGELTVGEQLPPARELSLRMGVSRPVISAGLVELEKLGFVEIKARQGRVIAIVSYGDETISKIADEVIELPETLECLEPLLATIPLQLLAYHVAVCKGKDVDQPRNLAKSVTVE